MSEAVETAVALYRAALRDGSDAAHDPLNANVAALSPPDFMEYAKATA